MSNAATSLPSLTPLARALLERYQRGVPISEQPFREIAQALGCSEEDLLTTVRALRESGVISRVGPVFRPRTVGVGTLAAMEVPPERLEAVAELVNGFDAVNHNYVREHRYNLWFVVTAADRAAVEAVLRTIELDTGLKVIDMPLVEEYHLDLAFPLELVDDRGDHPIAR